MTHIKKTISLCLLIILAFSCSQRKSGDKLKVLFIGNSYTYYNSTPELLKALVLERFPEQDIETQLISGGGMTLEDHWQNENTLKTIETGAWDFVVLQEQSKLGMGVEIDYDSYFGQTDHFFEYARKFDTEIKRSGAKTVFLMTWSGRDRPQEQAILSHAYTAISKELDAIVVPVGLVWDKVRAIPTIDLYADDGGHPSPMGSYLSAVTLYATLMSDDPQGLSGIISGSRLSSSGEPLSDEELLIDLPAEGAHLIQEASWEVVHTMQESADFLHFEKPAPSYIIPQLNKGEVIQLKNITGKWYGSGTYSSEYLGQIMEIKEKNGQLEVALSFYSPHAQYEMRIDDVMIKENQMTLSFFDSLRARKSTLDLSLNNGNMKGLVTSSGRIEMYKHLSFSQEPIHEGIDLVAVELMHESFQANIEILGYTEAALQHYESYSRLIGGHYQPEEPYLNAVGYLFLQEENVNDALNVFELAKTYYPQSIDANQSYAEALIRVGRNEEAYAVYVKAYELAQKNGGEQLDAIETRLTKLKNNTSGDLEEEAMPPPPPPPQ